MQISINSKSYYFGDLEPGDVFRYDNCFFMVIDLNPKDLDATDYGAVNLITGEVSDDVMFDTKVDYLVNAGLKI